jgi:DNA-binding SARP family transcriptional activator
VPVVSFGVLGPLTADNEQGPVNLKGLRHRAVLARLLIAKGRVVPVGWLIDDLWDDPPAGALGAVQTFINALRKALEPGRAPRAPAQLLVTASPGYALRAAPEAVDAWRFEAAVTSAGELLADGRAEEARPLVDDALGLWRGPAYAEFADQEWARVEAARLDELRLLALGRRAEADLALGRAADLVPDLEARVASHPLREDGWRLLAMALYLAGRQGDALATLSRARAILRTELGVDPGPGLRQLEADVLAQAPHLSSPATAPKHLTLQPQPAEHPFVGRTSELAELVAAATTAGQTARPRLALLSGVAGAGKTALAKVLTEHLVGTGWTVAWGTSPELPGAPADWPWTQMFETLTATETTSAMVTSGSDRLAARFSRHRAIARTLSAASANGPVLLVFDDLQWADDETLTLLTALASDVDLGPVLIVGTYRSTEISAALTEALGRAARNEPTRIYLVGLTEPQVREMAQAITYRELTPTAARTIHARSAGNPFFVRELTRLWETDPHAALSGVPIGVRDVIRHRLAGLTETTRIHLRQAAVIGQEVDLEVLIGLAGDQDLVLDSIETAVITGFLVEQRAEQLRFTHALVQETLYADISRARRTRWHSAIAEIVEATRPAQVETIAHHLLRAGNLVPADRLAHHTRAAAESAQSRFAAPEAARLWGETIAALDRSGGDDARPRLTAVMGLVRALAVTGDLAQARLRRAEAVTAAEALGDPVLAAGVIGSFDVPAIWTANDDERLSARLAAAAERTLASLPADRQAERARLLITIAMERRADTGERGPQAARQAETIARGLADPTLLALALNGRFMQTFHRAGLAPERARIGEELLDLATEHGLVTFEVLGHLILIQARCALADLAAADRHAFAADSLAERHGLPLVGVFTDWYAALRLTMIGRTDDARTAYRTAATRLVGTGMAGLEEGILPLALFCLGAPDTAPIGENEPDWGPYQSWVRPLVLLAHGNVDQARAAALDIPDSPRDLLFEARSCLHAMAAIQIGDRPTLERLYTELLPAAGELAGAGSGLLSLGPTAQYLGRLATALGRHQDAADHYRQAAEITQNVQIAGKVQSPVERAGR